MFNPDCPDCTTIVCSPDDFTFDVIDDVILTQNNLFMITQNNNFITIQ